MACGNLYVAGSSVFPTYGASNPTLNLLALTLAAGRPSQKGDGMKSSRRDLGLGAAALAVLGGAALGYRRLFGRWYAPTPYDDLLHQIVDRGPAAQLGAMAAKPCRVSMSPSWRPGCASPASACSRRARSDAAAGRVMEVGGWIVPESVALYSALAAQGLFLKAGPE